MLIDLCVWELQFPKKAEALNRVVKARGVFLRLKKI